MDLIKFRKIEPLSMSILRASVLDHRTAVVLQDDTGDCLFLDIVEASALHAWLALAMREPQA